MRASSNKLLGTCVNALWIALVLNLIGDLPDDKNMNQYTICGCH